MNQFLVKYRNYFLFVALLATLAVSYFAQQERLLEASTTVNLPVEQVTASPSGKLEEFRLRRDASLQTDMAALQALCDQENLTAQTREDAAAKLQALIDTRQAQLALEGALTQSGVYPCVAVISPGSVTIVTEKATLSDGESALVMTLAQAHAGVEPSGVRVMTAN